jgi:hypothetical protein
MGSVLSGNSDLGVTLEIQLGRSKWRLILATQCGDSDGRTKVAFHSGDPMLRLFSADQNSRPFGRAKLATPKGGTIWRDYLAGFYKRLIQE